jgi:membrane-associated phospholipid phosphatase
MPDGAPTAEPDIDEPGVDEPVVSAEPHLRWWLEVLLVLAFYLIYTGIRNSISSTPAAADNALLNAERVIDVERFFGLFFEEGLQEAFLDNEAFIRFWNIFYGSLHFVVTIFAMVWTYVKYPWRYSLWRNTLCFTTATALIGFRYFPLMPPRLLDECGPFGACSDPAYGFVDTLATYPGLWSFDSGTMQEISNQYAAMPSLHVAWATWCFLVLYRYLPWRWAQVAIALYPVCTLFGVVVTGNHYWLDGVGGLAALGIGYLLGRASTGLVSRLRLRRRELQVARASE